MPELCPRCKGDFMKETTRTKKSTFGKSGVERVVAVYECESCGYEIEKADIGEF
jgi:predicted Zn-ribbon and HTH transcriptional regulator